MRGESSRSPSLTSESRPERSTSALPTPGDTSAGPLTPPASIPVAPGDLVVHSWRGRGEMVIELELAFGGALDEATLAKAAALLLDAEPVVGARLIVDPRLPRWEHLGAAGPDVLVVTGDAAEYERIRRSGIDATAGPQMRLCLHREARGDRLLVKMSHAAGDGVALQWLAARLADTYSSLATDPGYRPLPAAGTPRDLGSLLAHVPRREYPGILWDFVSFLVPRLFPRRTHALRLPLESTGEWVPVVRHLASPRQQELSLYAKARDATLNDVVLAAAYRAMASLGEWDGSTGLRINITVDLRRRYLPASRPMTISNLSSFECPFLVRTLGTRFEDTLANVAALTRRRKAKWPGLGGAMIGHAFAARKGLQGLAQSDAAASTGRVKPGRPIILSNEGKLDATRLTFASETPLAAHMLPPFINPPGLQICLSGYAGALTLAAVTRANGEQAVGAYLDALIAELPRLPTAAGVTSGR